jgi:hypothetical protein
MGGQKSAGMFQMEIFIVTLNIAAIPYIWTIPISYNQPTSLN